ncbi:MULTISPECIES: hypothetical protein [Bacillus]|uniref:Uncharacterized protein n=1 Tax=Bacillus cereus TaxID=1396 RepID=A0A2A8J6L4_BACCE|nr:MULTISPECIES: hypothetical protein [Bacillus]MDH4423348.1 hypothetical protein [Bacillus cereus]PER27693.1 hypothetical protein CN476_07075 [Bacillus cereus]PFA61539.1 hypothetical protein CN402_11005 [Bacillus sp. AFS015896]PGL77408.1 hypothetical protein CN931_24915 [Bacillus sp. AFS054943]PGU07387.1 hypothetical protein COD19_02325 [Bacillus cereus]
MKKLRVIPAILLSFCISYNVTFATDEDTHSTAKVAQHHTIANEEIHFFGSSISSFNYSHGDDLSVLVKNIGDSPFSYTLYNAKGSWMMDVTLKPGEQAISEFSINWSDWLPEGEYKIKFKNNDGSLSKAQVIAKPTI